MNSGFLDFAVNIPELEHFEGVGFRRWQKKMKFLLAALNVAYVLSTPKPVEQDNETLEATRRRLKWENDDLACRGHILIIDKLPPSWNKLHRALMQRKEELTMEQLDSHLYVEEGIRQKESKKKSGGRLIGASGSTINFVDEGKPYGNRKGKGKPERPQNLLSLRKMEKGKERHGLNVGCATVHTLKRTVKFGRKRCKAYLLVIMVKEVANGNKVKSLISFLIALKISLL
nr:Retrovirus-related Pol polyprotein from transposon TNT 1-94 [Ipomoea batatas]